MAVTFGEGGRAGSSSTRRYWVALSRPFADPLMEADFAGTEAFCGEMHRALSNGLGVGDAEVSFGTVAGLDVSGVIRAADPAQAQSTFAQKVDAALDEAAVTSGFKLALGSAPTLEAVPLSET